MKTLGVWAVVVGIVVAGCGDKAGGSSGGVTGIWKMDISAIVEAQKAALMVEMRGLVAGMKEEMAKIDALPDDQREKAMALVWDQIPQDQRELAKAMMAGEKEGAAVATKMLEAQLAGMKAVLDVREDRTFTTVMSMGANKESTVGAWTLAGSSLTLQPKTKDGMPLAGDEADPITLVLTDGRLEGKAPKTGETVVFKR